MLVNKERTKHVRVKGEVTGGEGSRENTKLQSSLHILNIKKKRKYVEGGV